VALRTVTEKNVGSLIPPSSPGVPAAEISEKIGLPENKVGSPNSATIGGRRYFRECSPQVFAHTTTSAFLQANIATRQDLFLRFSDEAFKSAGYLPESFDLYADQFDKVQKLDLRTVFNLAFHTDAQYFSTGSTLRRILPVTKSVLDVP
jgi:hypothetical protein